MEPIARTLARCMSCSRTLTVPTGVHTLVCPKCTHARLNKSTFGAPVERRQHVWLGSAKCCRCGQAAANLLLSYWCE